MSEDSRRLVDVRLAEDLASFADADRAHEVRVALFDLLDANVFRPRNGGDGPFRLHLSATDGRLAFAVCAADRDDAVARFALALAGVRRALRDYAAICDTYVDAIKAMPPSRIEAIDMGRRAMHDEGAELLRDKLAHAVEIDFETARRLFTLLHALLRRRAP